MKVYVPNDIDIKNVNCINLSDSNNILISTNDNHFYSLKYNDLASDYIIDNLSNLDVACHNVELTHDVFYRKDITNIMITFFIIALVCFYFPYKIFARAFGRWLKI